MWLDIDELQVYSSSCSSTPSIPTGVGDDEIRLYGGGGGLQTGIGAIEDRVNKLLSTDWAAFIVRATTLCPVGRDGTGRGAKKTRIDSSGRSFNESFRQRVD